jgi:hypothetical protein
MLKARSRKFRLALLCGTLVIALLAMSLPDYQYLARTAPSSEVSAQIEPQVITNVALNKPATGSAPCNANEGPAKAFNGSVSGGNSDKWCSQASAKFLQVDLGQNFNITSFVVRHASAGGESASPPWPRPRSAQGLEIGRPSSSRLA